MPNPKSILNEVQPNRKTDRIRKIWPDIKTFRAGFLTWGQVAGILAEHYGLEIDSRHLASVAQRIAKKPPAESVVEDGPEEGQSALDRKQRLEELRKKHGGNSRQDKQFIMKPYQGRNKDAE